MSDIIWGSVFQRVLTTRSVPGYENVAELNAQVMSLPRLNTTQAVGVFPGLGEDWRIQSAVDAFNASTTAEHLFVAGINSAERTFVQPTPELLRKRYGLRRLGNVAIQQGALHTLEQSEWLVEQLVSEGVDSLSLHVSDYHITRAIGTVIRTANKKGVRQQVFPVPVTIPEGFVVPETGVSGQDMIQGEVERTISYQDKGDVASLEEFVEYISWLKQQAIYQDYVAADKIS